jgi:hypothetical protein
MTRNRRRPPEGATIIYGLSEHGRSNIKYVGKSRKPDRRLRAHIDGAMEYGPDYFKPKNIWIRRVLAKGTGFDLVVLDWTIDPDRMLVLEDHWIARLLTQGVRLLNLTDGPHMMYPAHLRKITVDILLCPPREHRAFRRWLVEKERARLDREDRDDFSSWFQWAPSANRSIGPTTSRPHRRRASLM